MRINRLDILLIEDDETDIFFVEKATSESKYVKALRVVRNGLEAIKYLKGEAPFEDRQRNPMPNIILCDINMPQMNGFEFLTWLQEHKECSVIPTMIYSSSNVDADVRKAYQLGANAFFKKPMKVDEMLDFLKFSYEFWCRCECPPLPTKC